MGRVGSGRFACLAAAVGHVRKTSVLFSVGKFTKSNSDVAVLQYCVFICFHTRLGDKDNRKSVVSYRVMK